MGNYIPNSCMTKLKISLTCPSATLNYEPTLYKFGLLQFIIFLYTNLRGSCQSVEMKWNEQWERERERERERE